jgi:hypothetical protein
LISLTLLSFILVNRTLSLAEIQCLSSECGATDALHSTEPIPPCQQRRNSSTGCCAYMIFSYNKNRASVSFLNQSPGDEDPNVQYQVNQGFIFDLASSTDDTTMLTISVRCFRRNE